MYVPSIGRYLTRDPLPHNAIDLLYDQAYVYAHNNPVFRIDPSGKQSLPVLLQGRLPWKPHPTPKGEREKIQKACKCIECNEYHGFRVWWVMESGFIHPDGRAFGIACTTGNDECDAMRHCVVSCITAKKCGQNCSAGFWHRHEDPTTPGGVMDIDNNTVGRECASKGTGAAKGSCGPCVSCCAQQLLSGRLTVRKPEFKPSNPNGKDIPTNWPDCSQSGEGSNW